MSFASERVALFSFNAMAVRIELWTPRVRFRESGSIAGLPDNKDVFISCFKIGWEVSKDDDEVDGKLGLLHRSNDCFCCITTACTLPVFGVAENEIYVIK